MTQDVTHRLNGLRAEVAISVDPWGIAHIRAENRDDLFFAQGWNAARDRLWQIDLARKRGATVVPPFCIHCQSTRR